MLLDVACTLTDVISCVPYESHTLEFGPHDYLSQIIQIISKLRGGQQRYMPLLTSKIHDTMASTMNYSLPLVPATSSSRESEGATNTSSSSGSTPFGSPHFSATGSEQSGFGTFPYELGLSASPTTAGFPSVVMTTGIDYGKVTISAPMHIFSDPAAVYQLSDATLKFEPNG